VVETTGPTHLLVAISGSSSQCLHCCIAHFIILSTTIAMSNEVVDLCSSDDDVVDLCSSDEDGAAVVGTYDSVARMTAGTTILGVEDGKPSADLKVKGESKETTMTTTTQREKNWRDMHGRIKNLIDNDDDGIAAVTSGTAEYGWLYRMEDQLAAYDKDPAGFLSQKSSRALDSIEKVELVRPLVDEFRSRKISSRSNSRGRDRSNVHSSIASLSHGRGRSRSQSRSSVRRGSSSRSRSASRGSSGVVHWDRVDLSRYRAIGSKACANPANQVLFQQMCQMADYRLSVLGRCRENEGHYFTGAKWYRIANLLSEVSPPSHTACN